MIKVNELRIGNWLIFKGDPVQVESIDPQNEVISLGLKCAIRIKDQFGYSGKWLNHFEPIQLTHNLLDRCGYKKDPIDHNYYNTSTGLGPLSFVVNGEYCMIGLPIRCRNIKYVHELQNLIFDLTGQELDITTPPSTPA